MSRVILAWFVVVLVARITVAEPTPIAATWPAETDALYQKWMEADRKGSSRYDAAYGPALAKLAAAPDADIYFLKTVYDRRGKHDWLFLAARDQMGKLNSQRTFDAIAARLKSAQWAEREEAIGIIGAFHRQESAGLLAGILDNDPDRQVRWRAAEALIGHKDQVAEPALVRAVNGNDRRCATMSANALGEMNSQAGLMPVLNLLRQHGDDEWQEYAINAVSRYHKKAAVAALIEEYARLWPERAGTAKRLVEILPLRLGEYARITAKALGPTPDTLEQWRDWWAKAEPLLDDDLKLKETPAKPRTYREAEFAKAPEAIEFQASVDAREYRVGDPIRLNLTLENHSARPYSLIMPHVPSGWWPTMAYGIRLTRGKSVVLDMAPSDFYIGSYSGPPDFQTMAPAEIFHSNIGLQYFLRGDIDVPLPEGDYELAVAFDSSKYSGIKAVGVQLLHRWDARSVKFTIKGEARHDPMEIVHLIGQKFDLPWIEDDLLSRQAERHDRAWSILHAYGDSRLSPLVEKIEKEHPDSRYYFLRAKDLHPFEYHRPRRPDENGQTDNVKP